MSMKRIIVGRVYKAVTAAILRLQFILQALTLSTPPRKTHCKSFFSQSFLCKFFFRSRPKWVLALYFLYSSLLWELAAREYRQPPRLTKSWPRSSPASQLILRTRRTTIQSGSGKEPASSTSGSALGLQNSVAVGSKPEMQLPSMYQIRMLVRLT